MSLFELIPSAVAQTTTGTAAGGNSPMEMLQQFFPFIIVIIAIIIIIIAVVIARVPLFGPILSWRFMSWTGKRSYGLYLWHYPIYQIFSVFRLPGSHPGFEAYVGEFVLSFVAAALSWRYVEAPLNRYRTKFQRFEKIPAGFAT